MDDSIKKVISLYLDEPSGGSYCNNSPEYRAAQDAFQEELAEIEGDTYDLGIAVDRLVALMEKLAFTDGFTAGVKHMQGLERLGRDCTAKQ